MPTYDYVCTACSHEQEEFHGMTEEPQIVCPECGKPMKKAITANYGGFKMVKDGTRNTAYSTRFGKKKTDNLPTTAESAMAKAKAQMAESAAAKKGNSSDPYAEFR